MKKIILCVLFLVVPVTTYAAKCFYLASYHQGYQWSDDLEQGLRNRLQGKCEIKQWNMDTKRNKSEAFKRKIAEQARDAILQWQPDVIIASDDNASKYVIQPYFKNKQIPVVFCGINWTAKSYGYPYRNATGMIEVAPIAELFKKIELIQGRPKKAFYLGADVITEKKNLQRFQTESKKLNIALDYKMVSTTDEWISAYKVAQDYDVLIIGGNVGINDWNKRIILQAIESNTRILSVTIQDWVMPYTQFGMTKIAQEQGDWAGQVAIAILQGVKPSEIPVVANRKWDLLVNPRLLSVSKVYIPKYLMKKAKKVP